MTYFYNGLTIIMVITIPVTLYFLVMVKLTLNELRGVMMRAQPHNVVEREPLDELADNIDKILHRVNITIHSRLNELAKEEPEYAIDHIRLFAAAHLIENELNYQNAIPFLERIRDYIEVGEIPTTEHGTYVLESITDKQLVYRIKQIVRDGLRTVNLNGIPPQTLRATVTATMFKAMSPKVEQ